MEVQAVHRELPPLWLRSCEWEAAAWWHTAPRPRPLTLVPLYGCYLHTAVLVPARWLPKGYTRAHHMHARTRLLLLGLLTLLPNTRLFVEGRLYTNSESVQVELHCPPIKVPFTSLRTQNTHCIYSSTVLKYSFEPLRYFIIGYFQWLFPCYI